MARGAVLAVLVAVGITSWAPSGVAQPAGVLENLRRDVEALKEGQASIQKDLQEIKALLRARPTVAGAPPTEVVVNTDGAPFKGKKDARVTLIEFTDYQCPFCSRYVRETYPQIEKEYIHTGKVKYVLRDLPLESIHPLAMKAAEATHCAGDQGKYWEMHDRLFANQRKLARPDLSSHAQALGLDVPAFDQCVDSGKSAAGIRKDIAEAQKLQANGTPTFFVGLTVSNNSQVKGTRLVGAQPYEAFRDAIERLLSSQE